MGSRFQIGCQRSSAIVPGSIRSRVSHTSSSFGAMTSRPARRLTSQIQTNAASFPSIAGARSENHTTSSRKFHRLCAQSWISSGPRTIGKGKDCYIPVHQDKKITTGSLGRVETASRIFNVSLGAVRPFLVTPLASLGKTDRKEIDILAEFPMQPGDLYVLEGDVNKRFGHGVPRDPLVKDLRVSWVFRTVNACFVNPAEQTFREAAGKVRQIKPETEAIAKRPRVTEACK